MKIWFDLCHPPQVLFFSPVIRRLEERGHTVIITIRERYQVRDLCHIYGLEYKSIGLDYGSAIWRKMLGFFHRTCSLLHFAKTEKPDIAVSQGSSYQVMAALLARIPSIFMTDYENIFLGIANRFASVIAVPKIIPMETIRARGIPEKKLIRYPGLKEFTYIYQPSMKNESHLKDEMGIRKDAIVAVLRPPETRAHYHDRRSETLFMEALRKVISHPEAVVVYLPRHEDQYRWIANLQRVNTGRILIPQKVLNGIDLIAISDLVVGAGGTMNREAAVLGIPVYSIFTGPRGAVDRYLEKEGRLVQVRNSSEVALIKVVKKKRHRPMRQQESLVAFLTDTIERTALRP